MGVKMTSRDKKDSFIIFINYGIRDPHHYQNELRVYVRVLSRNPRYLHFPNLPTLPRSSVFEGLSVITHARSVQITLALAALALQRE